MFCLLLLLLLLLLLCNFLFFQIFFSTYFLSNFKFIVVNVLLAVFFCFQLIVFKYKILEICSIFLHLMYFNNTLPPRQRFLFLYFYFCIDYFIACNFFFYRQTFPKRRVQIRKLISLNLFIFK